MRLLPSTKILLVIAAFLVLTASAEDGWCASPLSEGGDKAQECGATNPERPKECCDGYTCGRSKRCIPAFGDNADRCASESSTYGDRALECGGGNLDFPQECCEGHTCEEGTYRCIPEKSTRVGDYPEEHCDYWASNGECEDNPDFMLFGCPGYCEKSGSKAVIPITPSKPSLFQTPSTCGGYRSKTLECGAKGSSHIKRCCKGYKCASGNIVCMPARNDLEPLRREGDPFVQGRPIELKRDITVVGSTFETEDYGGTVWLMVPEQAQKGDLLLLFIGGSSSRVMPKRPMDFEVIEAVGETDINLTGLYKWYDDDFEVSVGGGYNTFVTLSVIRGVDRTDPVVDSVSVQESASGKDGKAIAPAAYGVKGGITFSAFAFDDPHIAQLQSRGYDTLATNRAGDDGMAVYVSGCESTGYTEEVFVAGTYQKGGGNDVTMTVTLRPAGGPYNKAP